MKNITNGITCSQRIHALTGMIAAFNRVMIQGVTRSGGLSRKPQPDPAEKNAFFPSPLSLGLYIPPKTDFSGVWQGKEGNDETVLYGKSRKILMLATEDRYMTMTNGTEFSTGNHPVEMLLPLMHLVGAGFEIDIATLSGKSAKLEDWAMPSQDTAVQAAYQKFLPQLTNPLNLNEVIESRLGSESDYLAIFIPGGHGVLNGIPESVLVQQLLDWAMQSDRFIISLCHGPAALLSSTIGRSNSIFAGYEVCAFPDKVDKRQNVKIGYLPGEMPWLVGERLESIGVKVMNSGLAGQVHRDRNLLTGDSPLASDNLGILAVNVLCEYLKSARETL